MQMRLATLCLIVLAACGSHSGVVAGAQDSHCQGTTPQPPTAYMCGTATTADPAGTVAEYGATLSNAAGDDDDCKWHLAWTASDVAQNKDITFTLTATWLSGGTPVSGGKPYIEAFLSDTHPAPNSTSTSTESPAGTYKIGPIRFDQKGKWTTRYHLFADCADGDNSLHGHAAFYVDVP